MTPGGYQWHAGAWQLARAALARGAHALLIAGARGLGKHELALDLAASCLCQTRATDARACGACESCRWLAAGTHPDLAVLAPPVEDENEERPARSPASARGKPIGVDQVRELNSKLWLSAHRAAGKVVVVQPADSLNLAAANALLKSLEEPPPGTVFLLVSDRPALLLATVRSRCQTVPVRVDDPEAVEAWLHEKGVGDPKLQLALCGGAPLQAAAIAEDPAWRRRPDFLNALASETADAVRIAESFRDLAPGLVLSWLQTWTFDLVQARLCARVRYHRDLEALILRIAATLDPVAATRLHRGLVGFQRHVNHPLNPRLFVEQMLIGYRRAVSNEVSG